MSELPSGLPGKSPTLIKATEAVEIAIEEGGLTLLQRRVYNALYLFAGPDLLKKETHAVALVDLARELDYSSRNMEHMIKALLGLTVVQVRWNYFASGRGRNGLGASPMLAQAEVMGPMVFFSFPPKLRAVLYAATKPAYIEFAVQRQLTSIYSQSLYELLAASRGSVQGVHYTPAYPLEDVRRVLAVPESALYQEFRRLNARVLKPAVLELSAVSPYTVEVFTLKKERVVTAVRFGTTPKPAALPGPSELAARLTALGCSDQQANKLLLQYQAQPEYLEGNVRYVEEQWKAGKVKRETPVPLLLEALKTDYRPRAVAVARALVTAGAASGQKRGEPGSQPTALDQAELLRRYHREQAQALEAQVELLDSVRRAALETGFSLYLQRIPALWGIYKKHGRESRAMRAAFLDYLQDPSCSFRAEPWPSFEHWLSGHDRKF